MQCVYLCVRYVLLVLLVTVEFDSTRKAEHVDRPIERSRLDEIVGELHYGGVHCLQKITGEKEVHSSSRRLRAVQSVRRAVIILHAASGIVGSDDSISLRERLVKSSVAAHRKLEL